MKLLHLCLISIILLNFVGLALSRSHHHHHDDSETKQLKAFLKMFKHFYNEIENNSELAHLLNDDPDVDSKARFFISGLLDSTMRGDWNKTFLNKVNYSNFQYDTVLSGFDLLVSASFNGSTSKDLALIKNATDVITNSLNKLLNSVFPFQGNSRKVPIPYQRIYEQLNSSLAHYHYSRFLNQTHCMLNRQYNLHATFLEIKWWARKDLHKSGLLWGQFDVNMTNCNTLSSSLTYSNAQKFFFGHVTARLGKNWTTDLTNLVSDSNFDHNNILSDLDVIAKNVYVRDIIDWTNAVNNISFIMNDVIQVLFPDDVIPINYSNIYDALNYTRYIYSDPSQFGDFVDSIKDSFNITDFIESKILASVRRDYSSAGFLWGKLNDIIMNNTVSLYNYAIEDEANNNMQARLLISGFLDQTTQGDWNKTFLNGVNATNFPYDLIITGFDLLSNVDFNDTEGTDFSKIWNATNQITQAFNTLLNSTFPLKNNRRTVTSQYQRIYKQITTSLKNYNFASFINKTKTLTNSQYDINSICFDIKWNANKDLHRVGLLWGRLDVNLSAILSVHQVLTASDTMAGKFFFGLSASKLGKNWDRTIVNNVTNDPFDYESIVYYLQMISDNIYDRWYLDWYHAVYGIYYILDDTITSLFPDQVPENMTNIFEHLNATRFLYSDLDTFSNYVDSVKGTVNLTDFLNAKLIKSLSRDNSSAGFLWGKFNEIIVSVNNQSERNETKDKYSRKLLKGFLKTTTHHKIPHSFLRLVNSSIFDYEAVVKGFLGLGINGYNFSANHTDEERFTESVGVLSLNLRNVLNLAYETSQKGEIVQSLNHSFNLFLNHRELLNKIEVLLTKRVDVRYYFQTAYEKAQYHSEFKLAGKIWGESVKLLTIENSSNCSYKIDKRSQGFLFGMMNSANSLWNQSVLDRVNSNNFNVSGIISELEMIERHLTDISSVKNSFFNIAYKVNDLINELFPLVGYGYRYGIVLRAIPKEYQNVFDTLNKTMELYSNFDEIRRVFEERKYHDVLKHTLKFIRKEKSYPEKVRKWEKMNAFIERKIFETPKINLIGLEATAIETKIVNEFLGFN